MFMTTERAPIEPMVSVPRPRGHLFQKHVTLPAAEIKARQSSKIRELGDALAVAGLFGLDEQASALGLSRSTTWTILKGQHKSSGLSATIINRMLAAPRLPPLVRTKILEYVAEKSAGRYGDSRARLSRFTARLSIA